MRTFSAAELGRCAAREVRQRRRVYARLVARGSMTEQDADREIAMMDEIRRVLEADAEAFVAHPRLL